MHKRYQNVVTRISDFRRVEIRGKPKEGIKRNHQLRPPGRTVITWAMSRCDLIRRHIPRDNDIV